MNVLSPAWLLLLAPWAGLVVLCLRAFRPKVFVPFLDLWPTEIPEPSKQRHWRVPPWPILLLLASLLLMILALASPQIRHSSPKLHKLTIMVDRGVTMLAGGRLQKAADSLSAAANGLLSPDATIQVIEPGRNRIVPVSQLREVIAESPTALRVKNELGNLLRQLSGPIVLVSDMPIPPSPQANVIVCAPVGAPDNVGIVSAAANRGKCLLTLRNDSSRTSVKVLLVCAGKTAVDQTLDLPASGQQKSYTLDVPAELLKVQLLSLSDDLEDDNVMWMVPRPVAQLAVSAGLPPRVAKFVQSYSAARPPLPISHEVTVASWPVEPKENAIIVARSSDRLNVNEKVVPDHPILREVRLTKMVMAANGEAIKLPLKSGWRLLLGTTDRPLLAIDEENHRVWVGYEPVNEEDTADWLILMTNIVDYLARPFYSSESPHLLPNDWKRIEPGPLEGVSGTRYGVYQRGGEMKAINVPAPTIRECSPADIRPALLAYADAQTQIPISTWLWTAAAAMIAAAVSIRK